MVLPLTFPSSMIVGSISVGQVAAFCTAVRSVPVNSGGIAAVPTRLLPVSVTAISQSISSIAVPRRNHWKGEHEPAQDRRQSGTAFALTVALFQTCRYGENMTNSTRTGPWIQTHSGRQYFLLDPHPADILIDDIAHALAHECRFGGHSSRHYSVAEHSVHVSRLVPPEHQLAGLLHDATEAYLKDITRPLKQLLPDYQALEKRHWFVISAKFGLDFDLPQCVKDADAAMVFLERRRLFADPVESPDWGHGLDEPAELPDMGPLGWPAAHAKRQFYDRFFELANRRDAA